MLKYMYRLMMYVLYVHIYIDLQSLPCGHDGHRWLRSPFATIPNFADFFAELRSIDHHSGLSIAAI